MPQEPKSPAVVAFENEKAKTVPEEHSEFQEALEDTFPASDPVSVSSTVTGPGSPDEHSRAASTVPAPLVDQALQTVRIRESETSFGEDELAALKEELLSLQARVETAGIELKDKAVNQLQDGVERSRSIVRQRPWQAMAAAGIVGFLFGISR